MKEKCKFCKFKLDSSETVCPVCGIEKNKSEKDLTEEQDDILSVAWLVRFLAAFAQCIAICTVVFSFYTGHSFLAEKSPAFRHNFHLLMGWGYFLFPFGYLLRGYKRMSFYTGVIFFGLFILVACATLIYFLLHPEEKGLVGIVPCIVFLLVNVFFLYGIIAAKKLFLR